MDWIAPSLVALGGILTAIVAWRRAGVEANERHASGWKELYEKAEERAEKADERLTLLEQAQEATEQEARDAKRRVWELEQQRQEDEKRFLALERDHMELVKARQVDQERIRELTDRVNTYRHVTNMLIQQIRDAGLLPVIKPDDGEKGAGDDGGR